MKKNKNQNGAISLFVLLSMMFFLAFMFGAFSLVTRRSAAQAEALDETQKIYNSGASASDIYDSILAPSDTVIPIANKEQLMKVIEIAEADTDSEANYIIDEKLYTYKKDANYILQNDIVLDLKDEINGKNNINIYDYILYSSKANIDTNGYDIYYSQTDGSIWKCVSYQNIGTTSSSNLFTTNEENTNYYGRSYTANLYSILEDGIDNYKKAWDATTNFEFMLMYNCYDGNFNSSKYNRWRQTNNPAKENIVDTENGQQVQGYTIDFTGGTTDGLGSENYWGGLSRSTSSYAFLDGAVGNQALHYAVAVTKWEGDNGIPVSNSTNGGTETASECLLFVRVK